MALRIRDIDDKQSDVNMENMDEIKHKSEYFDLQFARIHNKIRKSSEKTRRFSRISSATNKFTITNFVCIDEKNHMDNAQGYDNGDDTYLDSIFDELSNKGIDFEVINELKKYIIFEEYDTESVEFDMQIKNGNGNISNHINNKKCIDCIIEMFHEAHCMFRSLS